MGKILKPLAVNLALLEQQMLRVDKPKITSVPFHCFIITKNIQ